MTENLKMSREQLETTVDTLKTTQAHLIQSEKLSGIGEFIAGVAHELNNPLTTVMGFSELLQQADADPQHKRQLDMIHKSALRCQKIVQALLSFARRRAPERKSVCLNSLVESAVEILHYQFRTSNIEVITRLAPDLPQAMVDPHQVQQVLVNIFNNGRQAIEAHQPKGWIKVTTGTVGEFVRLTIQDSGPGITPENLSKIFDPFFTTKEVGKGTGLGLSLCYGIIKEHGGTIAARSRPGEGATFVIELPITHEAAEENDADPALELNSANPRDGAGKRVLVIDDEEPILQMVRDALTPCGYEVDIASDGESGLRQIGRKQYDVALCDWKMPGLNGQQVYERLRAINPALSSRIIFITGDVINEKTRRFLEQQNKICLPKPFTMLEFRTAIKKVLEAK
jgi:two-component system NtrC family sensor kinase